MEKVEFVIIRVFVGITCPLIAFAVPWLALATLHIYFNAFPLIVVKISAISGLIIGILFDVVFLRKWVSNFYMADLRIIFVYYFILCALSITFLMGLPVGVITLGIVASIYMGRRLSFSYNRKDTPISSLHNTALITALVTFSTALPVGILVKHDFERINQVKFLFVFFYHLLNGMTGYLTIGILCVLLFGMQYWLSSKAGIISFRVFTRPTSC